MTNSKSTTPSLQRVVGGILRRDGRVLLCLRNRNRKHYPGVWDVPGGHVADDETCEQGLERELLEELGIRARVLRSGFLVVEKTQEVEIHYYLVDEWDGTVGNCAPDEHDELRWVTLLDLPHLPLAHPRYLSLLTSALSATN